MKISSKLVLNLAWEFVEDYTKSDTVSYLLIKPTINVNLKGLVETFYVRFKDRNLIVDAFGFPLQTELIKAPALRNVIVAESVETAAAIFNIGAYITLIFAVLLSVQSNPVFWVFVGMIQIISYIPYLDCEAPENLVYFLNQFFALSKASIPFDSLPSWFPNPT